MNMCLYMCLCTISLNLPNLDVIYHTQHSNGSLIFKEDIESFLSFDLPCLFYLFTVATLASASTTSSGKTALAHSSSRPAYIRKLVFRIVTLCSHWITWNLNVNPCNSSLNWFTVWILLAYSQYLSSDPQFNLFWYQQLCSIGLHQLNGNVEYLIPFKSSLCFTMPILNCLFTISTSPAHCQHQAQLIFFAASEVLAKNEGLVGRCL